MAIKKTATFERYTLQCMIRMERAQAIEKTLTEKDRNPELAKDLIKVCLERGLELNGDIMGQYYINANLGVVYDLEPKRDGLDRDGDTIEL